ncbi:MAG: transcriptional regulator [Deltaproteobacteria bacterium]|nr:transcriptional regulator [Candidatus Anaeroferrophillus wilburensis]MBN2888954.1 transcriptional regulator [Deltaproteobacteria bacterium]
MSTESASIRQQIIELLTEKHLGAWELSQDLGIREAEVYHHLDHVARSLASRNRRLEMVPASCLACGYQFIKRRRHTPPGRCPRCKSSHLSQPRYRVR